MKNLLFLGLDYIGVTSLYFSLSRPAPRIFLYHGVAPEVHNYGIFNYRKKFIGQACFEEQIIWLKKHFSLVPLTYIIERLESGIGFAPGVSAITFDDGYRNLFEYAFPILKKHNVPAAVFITTGLFEKDPLWVDMLEYSLGHAEIPYVTIPVRGVATNFSLRTFQEKKEGDAKIRSYLKEVSLKERQQVIAAIVSATGKDLREVFLNSPYKGLTKGQIEEMQTEGIEFFPHTVSHPILSRLPKEDAEEEIRRSMQTMQEITGKSQTIFAYPNGQAGDFTKETVELLKNLGFRAALTTIPGDINKNTDTFSIPRYTLDGTEKGYFFRATASGLREKLRQLF